MSAAWTAGCTRARALATRRIGVRSAQQLAASPSLEAAVATLSASPYGYAVSPGQRLAEAQHAVAETLLWNLRVLAGWLPAPGARVLRALAGWFEIANVDEKVRALQDGGAGPLFRLGGLATAWPRLEATENLGEVRRVLATSAWRDPGGGDARSIRQQMLASWAARVGAAVPQTRSWVRPAAALLTVKTLLLEHQSLSDGAAAALDSALPGAAAVDEHNLPTLLSRLPPAERELLAGCAEASSRDADELALALWRAELGWWRRVEGDAFAMLRQSGLDSTPVVAAAAVLAVDAWRARSALAMAASGPRGRELFDAMA